MKEARHKLHMQYDLFKCNSRRTNLTKHDRKQVNGYWGFRFGEIDWEGIEGNILDNGSILYLDYDGGYMCICIYIFV